MAGFLGTSSESDVSTLIVGDVHGCADEFRQLVSLANAETVVLVGDLFTKGPDPVGVWRTITETGARAVLGNHDLRLLSAIEGKTKDQHAVSVCAALDTTGDEWRQWLSACPLFLRLGQYVVVHAGIHPHLGVPGTTRKMATTMRQWPMKQPNAPKWHDVYDGAEGVIFGHDAKQGLVWKKRQGSPWLVGLDTGCVYGGGLSGFLLEAQRRIHVEAARAYCPI